MKDNPNDYRRPIPESQEQYRRTVKNGKNVHAGKPEYLYKNGRRGFKGVLI